MGTEGGVGGTIGAWPGVYWGWGGQFSRSDLDQKVSLPSRDMKQGNIKKVVSKYQNDAKHRIDILASFDTELSIHNTAAPDSY